MAPDREEIVVRNNEAESRFEAQVDGHLAVAEYRRPGKGKSDIIIFTHTEVPEALSGRGVANKLARTALDSARNQGLRVIPLCPFMAGYISRHTEYVDLVPPEYRSYIGTGG